MNALRKILFPFSILYGLITAIRIFFDIGVLNPTFLCQLLLLVI
jgi:hypothetical protein